MCHVETKIQARLVDFEFEKRGASGGMVKTKRIRSEEEPKVAQTRDGQRFTNVRCLKVTRGDDDRNIQNILKLGKRLWQPDCKFHKCGGQTDNHSTEQLSHKHTEPSKLKQKQ